MTEPEERTVERIRKLLDRAAHPNTPEGERDACLAKADDLMVKYSIDQALLNQSRSKEEREKPERRDIEFFDASSPLRGGLSTILEELARLCDVRVVRLSNARKHATVGFSADIDYLELLFLSVRNDFQQKMFPKWDPDGDLDENIYRFKVAGYKWIQIWKTGAQQHRTPMPCTSPPKDGGYLIRAYKRHAKKVGDARPIATQSFDRYRASYAAGFVNTINERVTTMTAHRRTEEASSGSGAEVALRDRRADVLEALYVEFPFLRPPSDEELERDAAEARARREREQAEFDAWWAKATEAQKNKYYREQERKQRDYARWEAEYHRRHRVDPEGYGAGSRAAASIDLSGGRNNLGSQGREIGR